MDIDQIYGTGGGKFLKVADLQGRSVKVTVERTSVETLKSEEGDKQQVVLHFVGKEKVLGLNKTNAETMAALTGSRRPSDWQGYQIQLNPARTHFRDKVVDCVRIDLNYSQPPQNANARAGNPQARTAASVADFEPPF